MIDDKFPTVSIVVPVYNAESTLALCLGSLINLDYPSERLEILVVDNNSRDSSREIISRFPVICLEEKIQTSYAARNRGIAEAKGEIIAFTDSDCIVDAKWLRNLLSGFQGEDIGCCAGEVVPFNPRSLVEVYQARKGILSQTATLNKNGGA